MKLAFLILCIFTLAVSSDLLSVFLTQKTPEKVDIHNLNYPIWPPSFNVTLLKLNYIDQSIRWTKLFYDYKNHRSKFEFYDNYVDKEGNWGKKNFEVLFIKSTCWFIYPKNNSFSKIELNNSLHCQIKISTFYFSTLVKNNKI
jgi:hypothetical protein